MARQKEHFNDFDNLLASGCVGRSISPKGGFKKETPWWLLWPAPLCGHNGGSTLNFVSTFSSLPNGHMGISFMRWISVVVVSVGVCFAPTWFCSDTGDGGV